MVPNVCVSSARSLCFHQSIKYNTHTNIPENFTTIPILYIGRDNTVFHSHETFEMSLHLHNGEAFETEQLLNDRLARCAQIAVKA